VIGHAIFPSSKYLPVHSPDQLVMDHSSRVCYIYCARHA
jgi:hypothetical protein